MVENLYEHLPWDTFTFGYKVARITSSSMSPAHLEKLLLNLKQQGFRLVYWSVDPDNTLLNIVAEQAGGWLADEKVTYTTQLSTNHLVINNTNAAIQSYSNAVLPTDLQQLALQSGVYSRFNLDPNFKNQEFEKLYTAWLQNSINNKVAREVVVYRLEDVIIGFITLSEKNKTGQIGLFAVEEQNRRQGIGTQLLEIALHKFYSYGCQQVLVSTQRRNQAACRFYEKSGFILKNRENVYHFWL
ncbi:GNAT family N-acetyltransferase [Adhaeribacter radiodurans]|uniref:GNAT family N-acetyltransferase n=1 Tax=Adhaeribacter radiodurans TaxID=2745197 RepID=A0A7L7L1Y6_9BACT|nr:GNAT family N-acetyltransferase [Adhaeribacter radiodurans]QMU26808.1 GNAT family N-acetyltransferase [Adhaeribacter radiodurans]